MNVNVKNIVDLRPLQSERKNPDRQVAIISAVAFMVLIAIGAEGALNHTEYFHMSMLDWIVLGLAAFMGPYGIYTSFRVRNLRLVEERVPDFLRDVAEAGRFGMTLADSIITASGGQYGKLTPEIARMASQIDWGVPATEAIRLFAERMKSPLITRISNIIIKATDAGGAVSDVLNMVAHDARETLINRKERAIAMSTYMVVIYISFAVFLATIAILESSFIPQIQKAGTQIGQTGGLSGAASPTQINTLAIGPVTIAFYLAVVVHAVGDGIMAGVIQDGRISNGMRHSAIMLIVGFIFMHVILGV